LRAISSQNASLTKRWMHFWPGYAIIMEHPSVSLNSKGIIKPLVILFRKLKGFLFKEIFFMADKRVTYSQQVDRKNIMLLRDVLATLPEYVKDYFR